MVAFCFSFWPVFEIWPKKYWDGKQKTTRRVSFVRRSRPCILLLAVLASGHSSILSSESDCDRYDGLRSQGAGTRGARWDERREVSGTWSGCFSFLQTANNTELLSVPPVTHSHFALPPLAQAREARPRLHIISTDRGYQTTGRCSPCTMR